MATHKDDESRGPTGRASCGECGAPFAGDQRYCLQCGARRGDLPAAVAAGIVASRAKSRTGGAAAGVAATPGGAPSGAPQSVPAAGEDGDTGRTPSWMPSRQAAAIAIFAMLGLGVVLGSATSQLTSAAPASQPIVLNMPQPAAPAPEAEEPEEAVEEEVAEAPAPEPEPEEVVEVPAEPAPFPIEEVVEEPIEEQPPAVPFDPEAEAEEEAEVIEPELEEEGLPEVKHAFVIVLGDNGYEELFGKGSPAKYLRKELPKKGELIPNYYAVASGSLANQIALISGQGPTAETAVNCPTYADILPGTVSAEGQVEGVGCVYPKEVETLPNQLEAAGERWRAYVEDIDHGAEIGQPVACRHPVLGGPDTSPVPLPGDAYETWRNPFVYFHSIINKQKGCEENVVGLEKLAYDLRTAKKTPALSYIVPNACHSGGEVPCEEGQPTGPLAVEAFLRKVVPAIMGSDAYKEGGLIAITSAQAPQVGEHADPSACCVVPEYPNLPAAATPPVSEGAVKTSGGGGQVGMLLISPFIEPGSVEESGYYNHFTLLLTLEELFGLEKLGYAAELALLPFESGEEKVFNVAQTAATGEEESTVVGGEEEESTSVTEEEAKAKEARTSSWSRQSPTLRRLLRWSQQSANRSGSAAP